MQALGASENVLHSHLLAFKLGRSSKVNPSSPETGAAQSVSALAQTSEASEISWNRCLTSDQIAHLRVTYE